MCKTYNDITIRKEMSEEQEIDWWMVVLSGRLEEGGKIISYAPPLRGIDMWKQRGRESRCMGIQKSLHMHGAQTHRASYGLRKNNSHLGQQAVDMEDWSGGNLYVAFLTLSRISNLACLALQSKWGVIETKIKVRPP